MNLAVTVQVKQKFWSKVLFQLILLLGKLRLLSLRKAVDITNYMLSKGAFKYRVDRGKWNNLEMSGKIVIDD